MRKVLIFLLCLSICLLNCSCETLPNMSEILSYQAQTIRFQVLIHDEKDIHADVYLEEGKISLTLSGNTLTKGITFDSENEEHLTIAYDGLQLNLPANEMSKAKKWMDCFRLPPDALWKIEKDTLGGIEVLICEKTDSSLFLYLDAATLLPLKITHDTMEIHILDVKTN